MPNYPENPINEAEKTLQKRYKKVLGSAVNPVLREGNSDRRAPLSVKKFAQQNPHQLGAWENTCKARVAHMENGDFFGNEQSLTLQNAEELSFLFVAENGDETLFKEGFKANAGDILDATFMSIAKLCRFYQASLEEAKADNLLWSLHLKATMMKVSDPLMFGAALQTYFADVFTKHARVFAEIKVNANLGLADLLYKINALELNQSDAIRADIAATLDKNAALAMVDSAKNISNLHVPSDIIIDASIPVVIRDSGKMWNKNNELQETLAVIPDRTYATMYSAVFDDCRENGAFNPSTMGSVANVGLMAQQAEEYGSHETTFIMPNAGKMYVLNQNNEALFTHEVQKGDIWRLCKTADIAVQDWARLAVQRAQITQSPAVFWLDNQRAHDKAVIAKVSDYLRTHADEIKDLKIALLAPVDAMRFTLARARQGENTISVTGNVLRDYLTDLFPILELGTSAKMLSIVPLLSGGGLFETGAGGSAPKHVQQFLAENYLRWDSLGEFSALGASLEHIANAPKSTYKHQNFQQKAAILAETLDTAISQFLAQNKSPARKVGQIDNRGSHFYLALYWANALAYQQKDLVLAALFDPLSQALMENEQKIVDEMLGAQGSTVNIHGYYHPNAEKTNAAMRQSKTFNTILNAFKND